MVSGSSLEEDRETRRKIIGGSQKACREQQGGGATSHDQPPCRVAHPRLRPYARGLLATARASLQGAAATGNTTPTRDYRPWLALPPAGATALAAGVVAGVAAH
ncbi:hypothetical protein B296_00046830 [Ensete ventricosum]|uniref:Uncharacterized protein n=1 Tax=Ensete ventricosum TaxID=4639 RepID=A0A426XE47_ENSVE|nr:hypothetical protein B296_00046830 [Ensete ventricosum]